MSRHDPSNDATTQPQDSPRRTAGGAFQRLVDIMRTLRGPGGCPWDREQTLDSLKPFVLEETYEVLDAIDRGDLDALPGEIGDFLFEGVFLAQIGADEGRFDVVDALEAIAAKLIRRHPHVFTDGSARGSASSLDSSAAVLEQWEQIKAREQEQQGDRRAVLAGMPRTLPALLRAYEIGTRVAAVGFDWDRPADVLDKIDEELRELRDAVAAEGHARAEEEMGDLLFTIANLSRRLGIEPETALRKANDKFAARFAAMEAHLEASGRSIHDATLEELESAWNHLKSVPPSTAPRPSSGS